MDKPTLLKELLLEYRQKHRISEEFYEKALKFQIGGGSHNLRLFSPFPFFDAQCKGSKVIDIDGNPYIDFWQGHFANILGHNPEVVTESLMQHFRKGEGLSTGFPGTHQKELAGLLCRLSGAEKVRFTTSGTLATMYAVMLAKAFTGRDLVMKIGGGWHGSQPYTLKGISIYRDGFNQLESAGLPMGIESSIVTTRFNDRNDLREQFRKVGEQVSCLIVEPFIGAGGFIFGKKNYIQEARKLTKKYGALLIFDEVVSGLRFHPGPAYSLYGINPDLSVFGKAIGGGMPLSAVAGKHEVMSLCGSEVDPARRVKFDGGTFSAHPASVLAGIVFIEHLIAHEKKIYPQIGKWGILARNGIEEIFNAHGFNVKCTGDGGSVAKNSSIVGVHFLRDTFDQIISPDQVWNGDVCDIDLREKVFKLAMLLEGFNIFHGYGSISFAHSESEIQGSLGAVERIAKRWRKYNIPE
jgi:glutamate-1-semialdehyde 2,1-aminomutase